MKHARLPLSQILPHPKNANVLTGKVRSAIVENIKTTGLYPPLIVRSLEKSIEFSKAHEEGLYQLLDGEHRKGILEELCHTEADVVIWEGITDKRALILLATLNQGGEDDEAKRAAMIREIVEFSDGEVDLVAMILPESVAEIEQYLGTHDNGTGGEQPEPPEQEEAKPRRSKARAVLLEVYCRDAEQEKKIRASINEWLAENDPDRSLEFREAAALEAMLEPVV